MPEGSDEAARGAASFGTPVSQLPWHLIPSFKPGETDVTEYTKKLEFLAGLWPAEHLSQLAPRAALLTEGTAFNKVTNLAPEKLTVNSKEGIKTLVEVLGGSWGKTDEEDKFSKFERAIYGTSQRADETHESFIARAEITFDEMVNGGSGTTLREVQAYVLLRQSGLNADEKRRIIMDSGGTLEYKKVVQSMKLLGSRFFSEMQNANKSVGRTKTYDINHVQDQSDEEDFEGGFAFVTDTQDVDHILDTLLAEGDEDALVVQQFEEGLIDTLQQDAEMATCLNTYLDARRRLNEKGKNRGFWPVRPNKGKGRGKGKGAPQGPFRPRKSLAQRILESDCRRCGKRGHWKAECPLNKGATPSASTNMVMNLTTEEFQFESEVVDEPPTDASILEEARVVVSRLPNHIPSDDECVFTCVLSTNKGSQTHIPSVQWVQSYRARLRRSGLPLAPDEPFRPESPYHGFPNSAATQKDPVLPQLHGVDPKAPLAKVQDLMQPKPEPEMEALTTVASHGSFGVVDLGASQTVIGQDQLQDLLRLLPESYRQQVKSGPCNTVFRFGNNSTVPSTRAVYLPAGTKWIRIAVVPTQTPFLLSNGMFRALGAVIDTTQQTIHFSKLGCTLPIHLSGRKLFLLDVLELIRTMKPHVKSQKVSGMPMCSWLVISAGAIRIMEGLPNHPWICLRQQMPLITPVHVMIPSGGRYQGTCYDQESRSDASEGARSASDPFRQSEEGPHIWPSLSGPGVRQVVSGTIGQIGSPRTSGISDLHSSPDGSPGGISRPDASHIKQECQQISADAPRNQEGTIGQRGGVQVRATGEARSAHDDRGTQSPTCQSGTGHPADRGAHPASRDRDLTGWETFPIPPDTHQFLAEAQLASDTNVADPCVECANQTTSNWVAQEMWTWLDQNGVNLAQAPKHHTHSQPRILEVYCSSKSQITRQCRLAGLQAYRFGQDEGI